MKQGINRLVLGSLLLGTLTLTGVRGTSAHQEADHPAHIHNGTCDTLGDVVAPLSDVSTSALNDGVASAGAAAVGLANPIETDVSITNVKMPLADIVAGQHAINVHRSADDISAYIACGEVGGTMIGASDLAVALRALNNSGESGVAYLHDNGDGTTTVTLMLVTAPAAPAAADAAGTQIAVLLGDMYIKSDVLTFKAGQAYTFVASNEGKATHELVIEHSGDVDQPLPTGGGVAEAPDIKPGATGTLVFTFPAPGKYQFACHEVGHFEAGMVIQIEVTE